MSNENEPLSRDRRDVVRVGGAAAFGAIAAWLTAGVSPVRAEALAQGAPVIDRLTVSVVIDSYQIAVAPDVKVGNVTIKRFGFALSDQPPGNPAHFGSCGRRHQSLGRLPGPPSPACPRAIQTVPMALLTRAVVVGVSAASSDEAIRCENYRSGQEGVKLFAIYLKEYFVSGVHITGQQTSSSGVNPGDPRRQIILPALSPTVASRRIPVKLKRYTTNTMRVVIYSSAAT